MARVLAFSLFSLCGCGTTADPRGLFNEELAVVGAFKAVCLAALTTSQDADEILLENTPVAGFARARPDEAERARGVTAKWIAPYAGRAEVTGGPLDSCTVAARSPRDPSGLREAVLAVVTETGLSFEETYSGTVNALGSYRDIRCHQASSETAWTVMLTTTERPASFFATTVAAEGTCRGLTDAANIAAPD